MCENEKNLKLGIMIKSLLKENSLSMRKLSIITNIDISTISRIVNGKQPANINHLQKIAQALNVTVDKLLIADGYELSNVKVKANSNVETIVDTIEELLKSSNLLEYEHIIECINKELYKYESYATTEEGKEIILNRFDDKLTEVSGTGPFIEELKKMYKRFCHKNSTMEEKTIIGSGILYFILSTDIIPDYTFPIGYIDDFIAIKLVLNKLSEFDKMHKFDVE